MITIEKFETKVGKLTVASRDGRVCAAGFDEQWPALERVLRRRFGDFPMKDAASPNAARIRAYLDGDVSAIDDVTVDLGGTPFQRAVWDALRRIPVGETTTYGELARALGKTHAVRAVGRANALNPVSVIVPCHRVIGKSGELTGYAGGIARKRWLLEHEARA
jgi:methylated-DNA-[protein]-cysteine S-methyltransferase